MASPASEWTSELFPALYSRDFLMQDEPGQCGRSPAGWSEESPGIGRDLPQLVENVETWGVIWSQDTLSSFWGFWCLGGRENGRKEEEGMPWVGEWEGLSGYWPRSELQRVVCLTQYWGFMDRPWVTPVHSSSLQRCCKTHWKVIRRKRKKPHVSCFEISKHLIKRKAYLTSKKA